MGLAIPVRTTSDPVSDTEKATLPLRSTLGSCAIATGSPDSVRRVASNGCAMSAESRTKSRYPGGAYAACDAAVMSRVAGLPSIDPIQIALEGNATYKKRRPSGRNEGNRWALSPCESSGFVTAAGGPPEAGTLKMPPARLPNRMTPSRFHVAPLNSGVSHTVWTGPPGTSTILSLPVAEKPMERLSGDQNICEPSSVPNTGWASRASSGRIQICLTPPRAATNATRRPSGDTAGIVVFCDPSRVRSGGSETKNLTGGDDAVSWRRKLDIGSRETAAVMNPTAAITQGIV